MGKTQTARIAAVTNSVQTTTWLNCGSVRSSRRLNQFNSRMSVGAEASVAASISSAVVVIANMEDTLRIAHNNGALQGAIHPPASAGLPTFAPCLQRGVQNH